MATFIPSISDRKRSDGTYSVRIRVTHKRALAYIPTNIYLDAKDITLKSKKIKNQSIIDKLEDICRQYRILLNNEYIEDLSALEVVELINLKSKRFRLDVFEYTEQLIEKMIPGTAKNYKAMLVSLEKCICKRTLDISELKKPILERYKSYLNEKGYLRANSMYLNSLKKVFNSACREFNGDEVDEWVIKHNPFRNFEIPKERVVDSQALTIDQLRELIKLPYKEASRNICKGKMDKFALGKDCFILSLCLLGINSVDMYYLEKPENNIIAYKRRKVMRAREDEGEMQARIDPYIENLIDKYKGGKDKLFKFSTQYKTPEIFNQTINKGLKLVLSELNKILKAKKIPTIKHLTYYAARHSMATIAKNDLMIDTVIIHEMLNHTPLESLKITARYIKKDYSLIWDANKKLLDYIFKDITLDIKQNKEFIKASNNKSGQRGIYITKNGTYRVSLFRNGKRYECGIHKTLDEAIIARDNKIKQLQDLE